MIIDFFENALKEHKKFRKSRPVSQLFMSSFGIFLKWNSISSIFFVRTFNKRLFCRKMVNIIEVSYPMAQIVGLAFIS